MWPPAMDRVVLGNPLSHWAVALSVVAAGFLGVRVLKTLVLGRLRVWAASTETTFDDFLVGVLEKAVLPLLYYAVLWAAARGLALHPAAQKALSVLGSALLAVYGVRFATRLVTYLVMDRWARDKSVDVQGLQGVFPVVKAALWLVGLMFFLDNMGVKISAVITGLGIGGVAVALAAQAVLGDLFSYIAILFDRPFSIGDEIVVDEHIGTVEHIGIKTTRVRSLSGELLVFPNANIAGARIRSFRGVTRRRVAATLGLVYETPTEKLKDLPAILKSVVDRAEGALFGRAHFASFGDSSLNFELVYFTLTPDVAGHMEVVQRVNFGVWDEFEKRGLQFAYPTRTLHLIQAGRG